MDSCSRTKSNETRASHLFLTAHIFRILLAPTNLVSLCFVDALSCYIPSAALVVFVAVPNPALVVAPCVAEITIENASLCLPYQYSRSHVGGLLMQ